MSKQFIRALVLKLCFFAAGTIAIAGEDDFTQPIKVDSQTQFVDGKNKTSVFKGNVNITQGTLIIDANEVEVNASEGEGKEIFTARGTPATYSQLLDNGQRVQASANEIKYTVHTRTISLMGTAELVRGTSSVSGNSIVYDMVSEQLVAEGSQNEGGGVTTIFQPELINDITDSSKKQEDDKKEDNPQ